VTLWQTPTEIPPWEDDGVHVWRVSLRREDRALQSAARLLSPDELARAERFLFERDRHRFIACRSALRILLANYVQESPRALQFQYNPFGKPELDALPLRFNVSHSGDWALIAVTQARRVGVDLECLRALDDVDALARTSLSAGELAVYFALPGDQRHQAFFNAWTRKEAVIKGSGTGLSRPLADCEVTFAPGQPVRLLQVDGDRDAAADWSLFALEPMPGYLGAVAVERPGARLACWEWSDTMGGNAGE
jgi:4'-phosphopantetheinyl transferase